MYLGGSPRPGEREREREDVRLGGREPKLGQLGLARASAAVWAARAGGRPNAVCAALCGELRELPGRARLAANLASGVRGKELHTSLVPD